MENVLLEFEDGISELLNLFNKAKDEIGDKPVSKDIRNTIVDFVRAYKDYKVTLNGSSNEDIAEAAKMVCVYGQMLGQHLSNTDLDQKIKKYGNELTNYAAEFRKSIESSSFLTFSLTGNGNEQLNIINDHQNYKSLNKQLDQISESHKLYDERIKNLLAESEQKAIRLQGKFEFLEQEYKEKLEEVSNIYEKELANIESKNKQLNEVIGEAASRVIISDYAISAEQERKTANDLRIGSLVCMVLIVLIAGYSFIESMHQSFDLSNSLLRLALVFLLSVPAAYLARESTKHRQQQYTHLQTSLDLKAINPYIASLPEEEQHKIKSEIAQRIFAPKDFQSISNESYPINSQEVIMALISKFGNDKDKQVD